MKQYQKRNTNRYSILSTIQGPLKSSQICIIRALIKWITKKLYKHVRHTGTQRIQDCQRTAKKKNDVCKAFLHFSKCFDVLISNKSLPYEIKS